MTGAEAKKRLQEQYKRQNKYIQENFDRISITLPKGTKERLKSCVSSSLNEYIKGLVLADLERLEGLQGVQDTLKPVWDWDTPEVDNEQTAGEKEHEEIPEFHGLRAAEWKKEIHSGKVPEPPTGTIMDEAAGEYLFYDGYVKQWYLGFDDE